MGWIVLGNFLLTVRDYVIIFPFVWVLVLRWC